MTLRSRIRFVIAVLLFTWALVLLLSAGGNRIRHQSVDRLTAAVDANRTLVQLESSVLDLQRQLVLLSGTFQLEQGVRFDPAVKENLHQVLVACRDDSNRLAAIAPDVENLVADVNLLLDDWQFISENIEENYVEAIKRQAMSAEPRSEALLMVAFPQAKERQRENVSVARQEFSVTSRWVDQILWICLSLGSVLCGWALFGLISRLSMGLSVLTDGATAFAAGDLGHELVMDGKDEFLDVASEMNRMATDLVQAKTLLEQHTTQLQESLKTLKQTQADLVQKERMAALGGLVAGVAHEVNTPLGVAFTAGTFCRDRFLEIQEEVLGGSMESERLQVAMQDSADALTLMIDNLGRSAHLIQSFKQVAVDRGHADIRSVRIGEWLDRVLTSLSPMAKRHGVTTEVDVGRDGTCELAAGELEQVVTNLVVNAMVHAFPPDLAHERTELAQIQLRVELEETQLTLSVTDNGRGMTEDESAHVFEPFFTTRRSVGGSGLGMHIVHEIVHERFDGTIELETEMGHGSSWCVRLPCPTPGLSRISFEAD